MNKIIDFFRSIFKPRYIYNLQRFEPIKENGFYILKELGTHTCIKARAEDIFESDLLYNINPYDIIFIAKFEEHDLKEKQKFKIIEENRDLSFTIQNEYSRRTINGKELLSEQNIIEKLDPASLIRIAYISGLKDGRKISDEISKSEKIKSSKSANLKVIK
ncbi:hypothetical protein [Xenorhabdus budapestensis]|uniref:Uncharacterized protein n=1 Tax=Xenorhabdus budapestensis TaxID=290110 RepID=A0A2D0J0I7_XENBU|nr:hypothetical protein [Xenorhabdus budapestensis]PHM27781.1 hypothetical protein Xbud_02090 [Xenorhabdus budapestensis]QTL38441.1 hypothetical protein HGO23_10970 [Xenorhabdus budapestensis]